MGFLGWLFDALLGGSQVPVAQPIPEPKRYFGGVPMSELNEIAKVMQFPGTDNSSGKPSHSLPLFLFFPVFILQIHISPLPKWSHVATRQIAGIHPA